MPGFKRTRQIDERAAPSQAFQGFGHSGDRDEVQTVLGRHSELCRIAALKRSYCWVLHCAVYALATPREMEVCLWETQFRWCPSSCLINHPNVGSMSVACLCVFFEGTPFCGFKGAKGHLSLCGRSPNKRRTHLFLVCFVSFWVSIFAQRAAFLRPG